MIEQLFGSKTRVKLLQLFYANPNRSFYVREITRKIDEQINSVRRELSNLLSIGIIKSDPNNNRLYYEVDQAYEFYRPLAVVFGGLKDEAPAKTKKLAPGSDRGAAKKGEAALAEPVVKASDEHPLVKALREVGNVEAAILTGQFTRDESAGVDVLIVGDVNATKVDHFIEELEKSENKELRFTTLTRENLDYRMQVNDRFINNIIAAKKQVIIDDHGLLAGA